MMWLFVPVLLVVYFIPGMVAYWRHHSRPHVVLLFNLLIGWTLIGWVITLVWAIANPEAGIKPAPMGSQLDPLPRGPVEPPPGDRTP
jgi:Superinfection immunity protein